MDTPPSGMPSPPLSPHGTPSSLASDFPSLSGSMYSVIGADTPCDVHSDFESPSQRRLPLASGFTSSDHPDSLNHLILPSLTLPNQDHHRGLGLSRTASIGQFQPHLHSPLIHQLRDASSDVEVSNMRLLVLGRHGAGKTFLSETLVQGLQPVEGWSYQDGVGRVLTAGPSSAVRITRADGWDEADEAQNVVDSVLHLVQAPFNELDQVFHPSASDAGAMGLSVDLLGSAASPLYTAAILVIPSSVPSTTEAHLIRVLSQHLPVVLFSLHRARRRHSPDYHHSRAHSRASSSHRPHRPTSRLHVYSPLHSRAPSVPTIEDEPSAAHTSAAPTSAPPFTSHRALRAWIFDSANAQNLKKESARKFFAWRNRERQIEALAAPEGAPIPAFPIPSDAFERFTFDQLFAEEDFATTDTDDADDSAAPAETDEESQIGLEHQEELARGFTEHRPLPEDPTWEAELSRMVAIRKRQSVTRMDTIRFPHHSHSAVRQPLSSIVQPPIPDYDADYFSEKREYSSDGQQQGNNKFYDCESEESAMPPSTAETHESAPSKASYYDPLHIPSLFSLIVSMLPDLTWRLWPVRRASHGLPTHANDLGGSEKTMMMLEVETGDEKKAGFGVSVPVIGVVCACAAAFCAGVAVGVRSVNGGTGILAVI